MSIIYRVLIFCDRCQGEHELHEDWRPIGDARWKHIAVRGWLQDANEDDAQYGHACPACVKEIRAKKVTT